jgi:alpha-1,3/alpha-1,6-mannosyltransferase
LALLRERLSSNAFVHLRLVIAGGYDDRLRENRETLLDLQELVQRHRLEEHVIFMRSCTESERLALLSRCRCVVYTPANEHFGFVPVEAMAAGRPVVAGASGGPLETVRHEQTGLLCCPTPQAFADALARLIADPVAAERMGQAGRLHVARNFSLAAFGTRLEAIVQELVAYSASRD